MTSACSCIEAAARVCDDADKSAHPADLADAIRALPCACACACVPAGSVVVPVEPSKRMLTASYYPDVPMEKRREIYKAMLAASQKDAKL